MTSANRLPAIDVLRGCAVLGILWMNITAFAFPEAVYFNPAAAGPPSTTDTALWSLGYVLVDGKMRGLFSMLFGASMLLFVDREEMAERNGITGQLRRSGWLFLIGLAHYLLLWWGDILMIYAVVSPFALLAARHDSMTLAKRAFLMFLIHFAICLIVVALLSAWAHAAAAPGASADSARGYAAFMAGLSDPASPGIRANYAIYRGGWLGIVNHALESFSGQWPMTLMLSAFDTLGFMLLGMAMVKGGFLTGRWDLEQYRRTARHCFLIGLPPMIALCAFIIAGGFAPLRSFTAYIAWSFPFRIPLTVGWAALILWLFGRYRQAPIFRRLGAAGRLALSNYLGSSILMTAIFYGWGLGLFGRVPLAALPLFVLGGWLVMLVWSPAWEARWGAGPMERLWRKMIRIGR